MAKIVVELAKDLEHHGSNLSIGLFVVCLFCHIASLSLDVMWPI